MADEYEKRKIAAQRAAENAELDEQMGRVPSGTARKRMAEYDSIVAERSAPKKKDPFAK